MTSWDPLSEGWREPSPESTLLSASGEPASAGGHVPLVWHGAAPGGDLAQLVESFQSLGLDEFEDFELVELAAAASRLASWAHHMAASAASELASRPSMEVSSPAEFSASLTPPRLAGEELAMRLGTSPRAGARLVREGILFSAHLSATGDALRTGLIDPLKARAIVDGLERVPLELALAVQEAVLPRAPQRTARQLAADVRATIVELDPVEAVARREAAMLGRHVSRPVPLADGMAGLWLRTGAVEASALYEAVDRAARKARFAGDGRTLDQLRADLLVERALHRGMLAGAGASNGEPIGSGLAPHCAPGHEAVRVDVRVLVPLSTLLGTREEAGLLVGHGPIDPELARSLARGGTWRRLVTDPLSGSVLDVGRTRYSPPAELAEHVRFRDLECVRPGCETSAWKAELDHVVPFDHRGGRGGPSAAANLAPLSKGCHQIKTHGGFHLERSSPSSYRWRTPTGHVYDVPVRPSLRALSRQDPIHRAREELEALAGPRTGRARAQGASRSPSSARGSTGPPPF